MRFCPECGAKLASGFPVTCASCGREHWRNAKPAAAGLVVREGQLLLVKRAHDPWRGAWCAPSGFCDGGEHPIHAAEREILEEAGVRARIIGFLGVWVGTYSDDLTATDAEFVSVAYYHAEVLDGGEASPDGFETVEVGWFPLDLLPPAETLAPPDRFPDVIAALRIAHQAGQLVTPLLDRPG
jgi:ADP-ribose pyrophosphatase YjhB (NUDIX family)